MIEQLLLFQSQFVDDASSGGLWIGGGSDHHVAGVSKGTLVSQSQASDESQLVREHEITATVRGRVINGPTDKVQLGQGSMDETKLTTENPTFRCLLVVSSGSETLAKITGRRSKSGGSFWPETSMQ